MVENFANREYIVDIDGGFRFTKIGLKEQAPLLEKVGIEASSIKTYAEYIYARNKAKPYFMEYLQEGLSERMKGKPDSIENQAIRSLVFGTKDDQEKMIARLEIKQSFKIV